MVLIKSGRGSVGRARRREWRVRNEPGFKEKRNAKTLKSYYKNKEYYQVYHRQIYEILKEFANNHCKLCGKLMHYKAKGLYCSECRWSNTIFMRYKNES